MSLSKKEERILKSIVVASENNPNKPEFPADNPKFPATPTSIISIPWLGRYTTNPICRITIYRPLSILLESREAPLLTMTNPLVCL